MSAKHTPGPWMYEIDGPLTNDMRHAVLAKSTGLWVAATYRSGTQAEDDKSLDADDEAKANAKLIAAAPDLLAALQNLIAWHDAEHNDNREAIDNARAVIAKATGGAT